MKQIFSALAVITMMIAAKNSDAQSKNAQSKSELAFNNTSIVVNMLLRSPDKKTFETKVSTVNIKAVRDFTRSYKNVEARWFKTEGGYIANFLSNGIDKRIVYNDHGGWLYNLLTYTEDHLPTDVRNMVKSNYFNYDIVVVFQYDLKDGSVYIIKLKDQSNVKMVRVCDGEMEEINMDKKS
jgi:hypothetical protein